MRFTVLSHAGLLVEHQGVQLLSDPWLIGSTYWRSWWNYPPVARELVASLKPNYIYLTHIHWDHFQSASLKLFPLDTPIIVPKGHFERMKRDLHGVGFKKVIELNHAESINLAPDFRLTSYAFDLLSDSALVLESPKVTLLNLNDCKIMGGPLRHLLRRHKRPDFVFASHSSANSRQCFEIIDAPETEVDDVQKYIERFYQFVTASGARYAVPFASNQCYLHKETFRFNESGRTPLMVNEYWEKHKITTPELKVMVSGDAWSEDEGFKFTGVDWFTDRERLLLEYQKEKSAVLEDFYKKEAAARVTMRHMTHFFPEFTNALPYLVRRKFKGHPIIYVLYAGENRSVYKVDLYEKSVSEMRFDELNDEKFPLQIHLSSYVMRHALGVNILAHLGIGKRVRYRVTRAEKKYADLYKTLLDLHEYEILPVKNFFRPRSIINWLQRWREVILFAQLAGEKIWTGSFNLDRHLVPAPREESSGAAGRVEQSAGAT